MNMISTGAFQTEMDASIKQETLAEKFARVWEKKNSKVARAGGVSLMALSLAACGSDDETTSTDTSSSSDTTTTTTPAGSAFVLAATADVITGTAGNDTINGTSGSVDGDTINAGAGNDTMSVTVSVADDDLSSFAATGLETLQIRGTGAAGGEVDLDLGDVAGLETLEFRRMAEDVIITNVQSLSTGLKISDTANAASTVSVSFDAAVVTGTADTATLTVDNNTAGQDFTVNGVETIAVTAVGDDNDINIDGDDLATVTVSGAGEISIDVDASTTTFDASAATGAVTMVATAAADVTATGGAGGDTFTMGTTLTAADTIAGGAGSDTLGVTGAGGAVIPASADVSGVETLSITSGGADTLDASIVSFDTITSVATNAAHTLTITKYTDETINLTESAGNALDVLNVSLTDATGSADALTVNVTNSDAATAFTIDDIDSTGGGIETLNLVLNQGVDIDDASDILIDDISSTHDTLNVSGDADVTLGGGVAITTAKIVSTSTGDITLNVGASTADITLGGGADTIAMGANLNSADSIDGGEGTDTMTIEPAAGTAAATIVGVESATIDFATAGATFSGVNVDGMSSITVDAASDEAVTIVNIDTTVADVRIGSTAAGAAGDAATIRYSTGSDSTHTLTIGDNTATPAADVDTGAITVSGNAGTLNLVSDAFAGNSIYALTANTATGLNITSTKALEVDDATGTGNIAATAATSATITSAGGAIVVDGAVDLSAATAISVDGADGNITVTGATTATKMETLTLSAAAGVTTTITGAVTSDADVSSVTMTATGASADLSVDGLIDVDHVRTVTATAKDGANIDIADIEFLGVDDDASTDIVTSMTFSATGTDASDNGSTVTVAQLVPAGASTLDSMTLISDADGTVDVTIAGANLTITTIDASGSLGDLDFDGSTMAAATSITTAGGTNNIRTEADTQDTIILGAAIGTDTIEIYETQGAGDYDIVRNFEAGAGGDVIELDVSALNPGTVALAAESGTTISDALVVSIFDDADGAAVDFDPTGLGANILRVTDTYANSTTLLAALAVADGADNVADNEDLLVLWTDGASSFLSVATGAGAKWADFDAINDLVSLEGTTVTDLHADNFAFI